MVSSNDTRVSIRFIYSAPRESGIAVVERYNIAKRVYASERLYFLESLLPVPRLWIDPKCALGTIIRKYTIS